MKKLVKYVKYIVPVIAGSMILEGCMVVNSCRGSWRKKNGFSYEVQKEKSIPNYNNAKNHSLYENAFLTKNSAKGLENF